MQTIVYLVRVLRQVQLGWLMGTFVNCLLQMMMYVLLTVRVFLPFGGKGPCTILLNIVSVIANLSVSTIKPSFRSLDAILLLIVQILFVQDVPLIVTVLDIARPFLVAISN